MRPGLAAAEERAWLETYLADLMNNQRVLVYAYAPLERLVKQLEKPTPRPAKEGGALAARLMSG
jgi:hypothetical protein